MVANMKLLLPFLTVVLACLRCGDGWFQYDPSPNPKSVVQVGSARFTVLTSHLVRMEWGKSNDAATFTFVNRYLEAPPFNVSKDGDWSVIQTSFLKLRYLPNNKSFDSNNLEVTVQLNASSSVTWRPEPTFNATLNGNLLGTVRTLDGVNGSVELDCLNQYNAGLHCTLGLISRSGYVVVDDTNHPQFDNSQWPWVVNQSFPQPSSSSCASVPKENRRDCGFPGISDFDCINKGCCYDTSETKNGIPTCYYSTESYQDLYFFGHGHDYKLALKEFTLVSGKIPIPPRYAFGVFYSRYWAYNDIGEMEIVNSYEERNIPLDVLVTDMDWHITFYKEAAEGKKDQAGETIGWTGFTWDSRLFPDPDGFLQWCKSKSLKNTLNVHPASGIQPWEEKYSEMAEAMGIDPTTNKYVPFVPSDLKFCTNWLQIVMKEREDQGIDFWWLDWQQGESWIKIPLVNPTFWLNHMFFMNPYHWNATTPQTRPFILHRWGGLGNHRYQVGFSGDVVPSWASLEFQVFFTLSASNVGYGYWSHDIGGHILPSPPELYTRWVQWGIFSPMFRTHCTKNADNDRRIWVYPLENYIIMRNAMILRASLVPYIYSQARQAYDEGISLLRPMYYDFPNVEEAYEYDHQYFFGEDILVAPVTEPVNVATQMATKKIWIPEGVYLSWFKGEMLTGPLVITRNFALSEIPVFVKAGSIIPMRTDDFAPLGSAQVLPTSLKLMMFIGNAEEGSTLLYEDDGNSTQYTEGKFSKTPVSYKMDTSNYLLDVTIGPVTGSFNGMILARAYEIRVPNFWPAKTVSLDGKALNYVPLESSFAAYSENSWTYDGSTLSLIINVVTKQSVHNSLKITVDYGFYKAFNPYWFPGFSGILQRLIQAKKLLDNQWGIDTVYQEDYASLLNATETGMKITYNPQNIMALTSVFKTDLQDGTKQVENLLGLKASVKEQILSQLTNL